MSTSDDYEKRWRAWNWYSQLDDAGRRAVNAKAKATRDANRAIAEAAAAGRPALWERLEPPRSVARLQRTYDRTQLIRRMHAAGFSFAEIGRRIGCGKEQAALMMRRFEHRPRAFKISPVERWLISWETVRSSAAFAVKAREEARAEAETAKRLAKPKVPKKPPRRTWYRPGPSVPRAILDIEPAEQGPAAFAYWVRVHFVTAWQSWGEGEAPPGVTPDGRGDPP